MPTEAGSNDVADPAQTGFTLLEVLIALIIFAIAFGALAAIFQTSLRQDRTAEALRDATSLAESELARFGRDRPLAPGRSEGASADGLRWQAEVSLARPVDEASGAALYRIRIEAGSADSAAERVTLETLRLGSGR